MLFAAPCVNILVQKIKILILHVLLDRMKTRAKNRCYKYSMIMNTREA